MTNRRQFNREAFTLIELLIVITIIAVLAGIAFPVTAKVLEAARVTQAKNDMKNIATALNTYQLEYGQHAIPSGYSGSQVGWFGLTTGLGESVLQALSGRNDSSVKNPRKLQFLETKTVDQPRGGVTIDSATSKPSGFFDPWGNAYHIMIDSDYDNHLDPNGVDDSSADAIQKSVLVISTGPGVPPGIA